jgi:hypothetical protein
MRDGAPVEDTNTEKCGHSTASADVWQSTVEHSRGDTFNILFCVTGQREGYVASARSGQGSRYYSQEQSTCARGGGGFEVHSSSG